MSFSFQSTSFLKICMKAIKCTQNKEIPWMGSVGQKKLNLCLSKIKDKTA